MIVLKVLGVAAATAAVLWFNYRWMVVCDRWKRRGPWDEREFD